MSLSFFSLFAQGGKNFKTVGVDEFEKYISDAKVCVLDVRTPAEHLQGYIPGTDYNIDVLESSFTAQALAKLPKGRPVALYCRSGNRSKTAAKILSSKGYEVVELGSGFNGWVSAGKKVARK